ncbi:hypothetical protein NIES4101_37550 [Calothrix sp. NIES-4101]|nr:hypothetical protein NIES4101_37550 [Calothrix sp. NIES-4101]
MPANNSNSSHRDSELSNLHLGLLAIPQSFLLQIGTVSVLMLVLAQKNATATLNAIGKASEEVFRGERLPILDFPDNRQTNDS